MGDRCYFELTCREEHKERFESIFHYDGAKIAGTEMWFFEEDEANYAFGFPDGFPEDVPYWGFHGEGGEYPGEEFACDGEQVASIETTSGDPCIRVREDGIDEDELKQAIEYFKIRKRAEIAVKKRKGGSIPKLSSMKEES